MNGGETGIRTLGTLASTTVFETVLFNHSSTSPKLGVHRRSAPVGQGLLQGEIFGKWGLTRGPLCGFSDPFTPVALCARVYM